MTDEAGGPIDRVPLLGVDAQHESLASPIDRRSDYYRQAAFLAAKDQPKRVRQPLLTIPNVLTFARLVMVPVLVALWYNPHEGARLAAAWVFLGASFTDWLDGYLARRVRDKRHDQLRPCRSTEAVLSPAAQDSHNFRRVPGSRRRQNYVSGCYRWCQLWTVPLLSYWLQLSVTQGGLSQGGHNTGPAHNKPPSPHHRKRHGHTCFGYHLSRDHHVCVEGVGGC